MGRVCRRIEPLLTPYCAGELPADTVTPVREHLAGCESCRARCRSLQRADAALRSHAGRIASAACPPEVWQRLQPQLQPVMPARRFAWRYALAGSLAVAALALGLTRGLLDSRQPGVALVPDAPRSSIAVVQAPAQAAPYEAPRPAQSAPPAPAAPDEFVAGGPTPDLPSSRAAPAPVEQAARRPPAHRQPTARRGRPSSSSPPSPEPAARPLREPAGSPAIEPQRQRLEPMPVMEFVLRPQWEAVQVPPAELEAPVGELVEYVLDAGPLPPAFLMESDGVPVLPVSTGRGQGGVSM